MKLFFIVNATIPFTVGWKNSILFLIALLLSSNAKPQSVLSSGSIYKFSVSRDGIYKLDYSNLKKAGVNVDGIDPSLIQVYSYPTGMLKQPNKISRPSDPVEVSIFVSGQEDGKFNKQDYILFYGQGPDLTTYDSTKQLFGHQINLYSTKNYYFVKVGTSNGKRIDLSANLGGNFPVIAAYDDFAYYESDKVNLIGTGRSWVGEQFENATPLTISFDLPGVIDGSYMTLTSRFLSQSINSSSLNLSLNEQVVYSKTLPPIPNTRYGQAATVTEDTTVVNANLVSASSLSAQQLRLQFNRGANGLSIGYLDYIQLQVKRRLALYGNSTQFRSVESIQNPFSTFSIANVKGDELLWDITDSFEPRAQVFNPEGTIAQFATTTSKLKQFILFNSKSYFTPDFETNIPCQNIKGLPATSLLIITYPGFSSEASRLAQFKNSNGITAAVVTTEQIYNEFSGGRQDVTAIRDFVRYNYNFNNKALRNVILFGRGSYDYKNRIGNNTNFVPIYESRNSLDPLVSYSSDDYYGFLEDSEGEWEEEPAVDYTLDIGVGRIPVKTISEAKAVVDKLISYTQPSTFGSWRKEMLFVADDGDFDIHMSMADQLAFIVDTYHPEWNVNKLYLDSYKQVTSNTGQYSPAASKELDLMVRKGLYLINYNGHGSERVWMQEQVLDPDIILNWSNGPFYPLFITATCEFGRNDDPSIISSAERILLQPSGGGIGLITTTRPVYSSTNFALNQAFYTALFESKPGTSLGLLFLQTKNKSLSGTTNRNFTLLGDPSMIFGDVDHSITLTKTDSLKPASPVTISGAIMKDASIDIQFNGKVEVTVYDRKQAIATLGDENPPFHYSLRTNKLFEGTATVRQGMFSLRFITPAILDSTIALGKISAYAYSSSSEARGANITVPVGGINKRLENGDSMPPVIHAYVGDTTFINGGIISPSTFAVATFHDLSGINISSFGGGQQITVQVDNQDPIIANDYYSSALDDFTRGFLKYPLDTLKPGPHQLTVMASDVFGNRNSSSIEFIVSSEADFQIQDFNAYPNPATDHATFQFVHNRPGTDLNVQMTMTDLLGQELSNYSYEISNSDCSVTLPSISWNTESGDGLILVKIKVTYRTDNRYAMETIKLMRLSR